MRDLNDFIGKRFMADHIRYRNEVLTLIKNEDGYFRLRIDTYGFYFQIDGSDLWDFRNEDVWFCLDEDGDFWEVE